MKLIHRLGYYGLGFFFGVVILIFFLGGKRASCDYSPTARVLKDIRTKKHEYSQNSLEFFRNNQIDTSVVSLILKDGDVDFGKSHTQTEPCKTYFIKGSEEFKMLELEIENCDSIARIKQGWIRKGE